MHLSCRMPIDVEEAIRVVLADACTLRDIETATPVPPSVWTRHAASIEQGGPLVVALVEPWADDPRTWEVVVHSLRLHLVARVLDDALDEGLVPDRLLMLRVQPLLWRVVLGLGRDFPPCEHALLELIESIVRANVDDWQDAALHSWKHKNDHLLVPVLLLDGPGGTRFTECREALVDALTTLQAVDEELQAAPSVRIDEYLVSWS